jgi:modification target Cys-rich repeat protein
MEVMVPQSLEDYEEGSKTKGTKGEDEDFDEEDYFK